MRGPLQKPRNNLRSDLEICPSLGNCSDPGEKSAALLQQLISRLFWNLFKTRPDPIHAKQRAIVQTDWLMAFELILVDAETHDFSVQRLAGNSQLGSCPRWARDSAPTLRERFFDHLPLAIFESRHQ